MQTIMLPELSTTDVLKIAGIYYVTTASTLLWLFRSSHHEIPKSFASAVSIATRNLVVHAGIVVLFCGYMDFTVDGLLKWWPLALLLFGLSFPKVFLPTLESLGSGTDAGSLVVGAFLALCLFTFVSPVYVLRQFVVRFQGLKNSLRDFDESNRPPATEPTLLKQTPNEYADQKTTAVVVAALRPMGKVKIGEKELNARHIFGTFIDSGTTVMVTGMQNGLLLVREAIGEADTGVDISSASD